MNQNKISASFVITNQNNTWLCTFNLKSMGTLNLLNNNMNDDCFGEFINCQPKVDSLKKVNE